MRVITVRRISQAFFLLLFLWFCTAATLGQEWWRLRGWPINWFLTVDPLMTIGTMLTTHTLYAPMVWALVAIGLTIILGRFFCGWVCPLGSLNHFLGWTAWRHRKILDKQAANQYSPGQKIKYYLLGFMLAGALVGSLQTGLLDPLPLVYRSVNLALAPILDARTQFLSLSHRYYSAVWLIGAIFLVILGLNLVRPRFFCRFICPLGALFGLLNRFSPFRIGKTAATCHNCDLCQAVCEGACQPAGRIRTSECILCLNCLEVCPHDRISFAPRASAGGEIAGPDLSRRSIIVALAAGVVGGPMWRLSGLAGPAWNPDLIRPPGSVAEVDFLARCTKCGQCMRVCPTNVIQPAIFESGWEGLWTPTLNYRLGQSGCQLNCIACGHVCPTAAIRPLEIEEKLGLGPYASQGPLRLGLAFVDRTRCLPWVMDRPCIVCQELCPVSPKAIFTRVYYEPIRQGQAVVIQAAGQDLDLDGLNLSGLDLAGGDYFIRPVGSGEPSLLRIAAFSGTGLTVLGQGKNPPGPGQAIEIVVRLQRPFVDPAYCIGCGVCEHECPVNGLRAIRITSENESRHRKRKIFLTT